MEFKLITEEYLLNNGWIKNEFGVFKNGDFKLGMDGDDFVNDFYTIKKGTNCSKVKYEYELINTCNLINF